MCFHVNSFTWFIDFVSHDSLYVFLWFFAHFFNTGFIFFTYDSLTRDLLKCFHMIQLIEVGGVHSFFHVTTLTTFLIISESVSIQWISVKNKHRNTQSCVKTHKHTQSVKTSVYSVSKKKKWIRCGIKSVKDLCEGVEA